MVFDFFEKNTGPKKPVCEPSTLHELYLPDAEPNPEPPNPPEVSNPVLPDCEDPLELPDPLELDDELPKFMALGSKFPEPKSMTKSKIQDHSCV